MTNGYDLLFFPSDKILFLQLLQEETHYFFGGNPKKLVVMKIIMCIFYYFGILISLLFLIRGYNCPINCTCEDYWASCNLITCDDEIITDVPFIIINGRLCPHHYRLLSDAAEDLHIQLHDSYCYDLEKCE